MKMRTDYCVKINFLIKCVKTELSYIAYPAGRMTCEKHLNTNKFN